MTKPLREKTTSVYALGRAPDNQQERFRSPLNLRWLDNIPSSIGYYLAGFADGEGSFTASLRKKRDYKNEWQISLAFNVAQRDVSTLKLFKQHLKCGRLQCRSDGVHYFVVGDYPSLQNHVVPFFDRYQILSENKRKNFLIFKKITSLVYQKKHLTHNGMKTVLELREELNKGKGRKRKYFIGDVIEESSTTTRRTRSIEREDMV
ncbi:MAG: LAGLIDADG homing endonuclease [Parcubacteria group bacterium GW2011_GWA2_47_8]|nr:MAG: LAGLIDADG homing endonuclease [Parcubacteria group bacterium GW2011_GWA2_47_8]OHB19699.1 MAG: hypothetical protein A2666_04150 [Parcubacteria group bacterium RIFCSPHIGHO2_01_FULL_47_10b]